MVGIVTVEERVGSRVEVVGVVGLVGRAVVELPAATAMGC